MGTGSLTLLIEVSAVTQGGLAVLNLFIVPLMRWHVHLKGMPLLLREVFMVHCWFISITVLIFATTSWLFAAEMVSGRNGALTWLSACIATFWTIRLVLQWTYYSWGHWRGRGWPTLVHVGCTLVYGGWSVVYWLVAARACLVIA